MEISTNCGLIIGLPYGEFVEALDTEKVSVEDFTEMIDNGELDVGSIYYDSSRDENIVGKWLSQPASLREITLENEGEFLKISGELKDQFPNIEFKLYVTNCVW